LALALALTGEAGGRREKEEGKTPSEPRTKGGWQGHGHARTVVCVVCACVEGREKVVSRRGAGRGHGNHLPREVSS